MNGEPFQERCLKLCKKLCVLMLILFAGCASNKTKESLTYLDKPKSDCIFIGNFKSMGFSLIPPVASAIAKEILEQQAGDLRANSLKMTKETGLFQVEMEATAYRCASIAKNNK